MSDRSTEGWQRTSTKSEETRPSANTNEESQYKPALDKSTALFGFLALGMALACKHQAVLFIPWVALLAWWRLDNRPLGYRGLWVLIGASLMFIVPMPYYIRTFFDTGAPMWPLMQKLFVKNFQYLHEVGAHYTKDFQGKHNLANFLLSLKTLIQTPFMPVSLWLLALGGMLFAREQRLRLWVGLPLFFGTLWSVQPKIYWRFPIYFTPFAALLTTLGYQALKRKALGHLERTPSSSEQQKEKTQTTKGPLWSLLRYSVLLGIGITCLFGVGIAGLYSKGLLSYHVHRDLERYHRATWYYSAYQRIMKETPKDAKLFVIVYAGQTYYLHRSYLRGDPVLSAALDWRTIKTPEALHRFLRKKGIDYIFYDRDSTWHFALAGKEMKQVMSQVQRSPLFQVLWQRDEAITLSRIRGTIRKTHTMLIKVKTPQRSQVTLRRPSNAQPKGPAP